MGGRDRWSSCAPGLAFLQHLPLGVMSDEADEMPQACLVLPKQPRVLGTVNWGHHRAAKELEPGLWEMGVARTKG